MKLSFDQFCFTDLGYKTLLPLAVDVLMHRVEKVLNCNMPEDEESLSGGGKNTNPLGDKAAHSNDSSQNVDCSTVLCVKTIHISSFILAAKSPFFYKLFSNGMRESEQRHVTLRIHASDKFEVASCMRYCSRLLQNLPKTCESALLCLDLPSNVLMAEAVQPPKEAAKEFLFLRIITLFNFFVIGQLRIKRFHNLQSAIRPPDWFQEEVLNFPLVGIEAVLSSDDLQVASEDAVYDFLLKWARTHYPKLEERREVLGTHIGRLIRFPYMTCRKLRTVLTCCSGKAMDMG
ncbi:BTB/POZ domain-containing protein POB1 [Camellia lanceoleosa]|uniref:BTB/POZ domain-containing protein POB1 n=1 Tax=Camellia lanceoleosa TaxID=1840588 RepID=A0ACC0FF41_9ERIC|nr:BTB/POZ domain-containing protein POB1 [Camellia lanceoleosa]